LQKIEICRKFATENRTKRRFYFMDNQISLQELSCENVKSITENQVFDFMKELENPSNKEFYNEKMAVINSAFQFRYLTPSKKILKKELEMYGFVFPNNEKVRNSNMIMGIKRK